MENTNTTTKKIFLLALILLVFAIIFLVLSKSSFRDLSGENEIKSPEIATNIDEEKEEPSEIPVKKESNLLKNEKNDKKISCENRGGEWFAESAVCEINSFSQNECLAQGGEFNECNSACRHDPEAEMCTMQCVLTCTFR